MNLNWETTTTFQKIHKAVHENRTVMAYGGSSSGKSWAFLQILCYYCIASGNEKIAIATISYPVYKRSILPDIKNILGPVWDVCRFNKAEGILTFPNGSVIHFVNASDANAAKGPRWTMVYIDEVILVSKDFFRQMAMRTSKKVLGSFNPSNSGSYLREYEGKPDTKFLHSTYRDNELLDPIIVRELEHFASTDKNFRDVYLNGEWGNKAGLIFDNWEIGEFKGPGKYIGLDIAFTKDYTAAILVQQDGRNIYCKEIIYEVGIRNQGIVDILKPLKKRVIADSSHQMTIDFMQTKGVYVEPVRKYAGFVVDRISHAQGFHLIVDPGSVNLIKALGIYSWQEKDGVYIDKPNHHYSDAVDALMYSLTACGFRSRIKVRGKV